MAKHKKAHHEEHIDESWLIPYADILTLLLALFIVLFASSQVDQKKLEMMSASLNSAFNGGTGMFMSSQAPNPTSITPPLPPPKPIADQMSPGKSDAAETAQLMATMQKVNEYIKQNQMEGKLEAVLMEEGLMIRIREVALFPSGSANLIPTAQGVARQIAKIIAPLGKKILISGHTDNVPINTGEFPSNWDLSTQRALRFMKFMLVQEPSLDPATFHVVGYGEYKPVANNDSEASRAKNRRVEIFVAKDSVAKNQRF